MNGYFDCKGNEAADRVLMVLELLNKSVSEQFCTRVMNIVLVILCHHAENVDHIEKNIHDLAQYFKIVKIFSDEFQNLIIGGLRESLEIEKCKQKI